MGKTPAKTFSFKLVKTIFNLKVLLIFSTIVGVVCKDGVVIGTEKLVLNKMMVPGTDKRLYSIDLNTGGVINGITPDGRAVIQRAREEVQ